MQFTPFVYVWDLVKERPPVILNASASIIALGHSDADQSILAVTMDGRVRRWNGTDHRLQTAVALELPRQPAHRQPGARYPVNLRAATFFAGGARLAVVGWTSGLHVIECDTGKETGRGGEATLVVASPTNKTLAITRHGRGDVYKRLGNEREHEKTISTIGTISLLAADTCCEQFKINVAGSDVWALAFSPDGKTLAATTGWETGQIHLYDVATGHEFRTIETPATRTPALAFSPDGSKLICGMADTSVLVWDLQAKP